MRIYHTGTPPPPGSHCGLFSSQHSYKELGHRISEGQLQLASPGLYQFQAAFPFSVIQGPAVDRQQRKEGCSYTYGSGHCSELIAFRLDAGVLHITEPAGLCSPLSAAVVGCVHATTVRALQHLFIKRFTGAMEPSVAMRVCISSPCTVQHSHQEFLQMFIVYLFNFLCVYTFTYEHRHIVACILQHNCRVRGQLSGISSFFLSCGSQGSNLGLWSWRQVPFLAEPSCQPSSVFNGQVGVTKLCFKLLEKQRRRSSCGLQNTKTDLRVSSVWATTTKIAPGFSGLSQTIG